MRMDGRFPETFVSTLRMQNASLFRAEKSLELASGRMRPYPRQMGRLFGPTGSKVRLDVPVVAEMVGTAKASSGDDDFEAWDRPKGLAKKGLAKRTSSFIVRQKKDWPKRRSMGDGEDSREKRKGARKS